MFFGKKAEADLEGSCRDFYEKNILHPVIGGVDAGAVFVETVRRSVAEADNNFDKIDLQRLTGEIMSMRFELFGLAWLHRFGDKLAVAQSAFTKRYLLERKRDDIWDGLEPYNQAIARSSTLGKTTETASGRAYLGSLTKMRAVFDQYTDSFADAEGNPVEPAHYGMSPGHPAETLVTVTFTEHGSKTKVTLHHAVPESVPERSGIQQGWTEMLDRLADELVKA